MPSRGCPARAPACRSAQDVVGCKWDCSSLLPRAPSWQAGVLPMSGALDASSSAAHSMALLAMLVEGAAGGWVASNRASHKVFYEKGAELRSATPSPRPSSQACTCNDQRRRLGASTLCFYSPSYVYVACATSFPGLLYFAANVTRRSSASTPPLPPSLPSLAGAPRRCAQDAHSARVDARGAGHAAAAGG